MTWAICKQAMLNILFIYKDNEQIHRIGIRLPSEDIPTTCICITALPGTLNEVMEYMEEVELECEYLIKDEDKWYALYEENKIHIIFEEKEMFEMH